MQSPEFRIGSRFIGLQYPPIVFAEVGINHEGSLQTAKLMVDAAKRAGCELIKHQTHIVEDEMTATAKQVIPGNAKESIYEIMARCALNEEDEAALKEYVEEQGMLFVSTPFSRAAVDRLERLHVQAYKIGSGECNNHPLVDYIASKGKPIILSTGMNSIESVQETVEIIRKRGVPFALLHCTSIYPTPYNKVRLPALRELAETFPDAVLGLSDHSLSNHPCLAAVTLGARILERHFTDTKNRPGPDISISMDEKEARELVEGSRIIYECMQGGKGVLTEEQPTIDFAYATVVAIRDIPAGATLTEADIWVKRPGTGEIPAKEFNGLLGKTVTADIPRDAHLRRSHIAQ